MDLRHLQTFKVIAEAGSFVQAAERLQYAQSTLTLQIQQLEMARGLPLAIGIEIGSLEIIKQAVQQGMGVAIMPKLATYHIPDDMLIRHIKDWKLRMPLGLITREVPLPQSKAVQAFSSLLKQAAADA